jgi:hypothetical protein
MAKVASGQKRALDLPEPEFDAPAFADGPDREEPAVVDLADLVSDRNGEVVLFNDSGLRALAVSTSAAVVERGEVGRHVTAAGEDVSGFCYLAFENGLRLFHQPDLELIIVPTPP